MRCAVAVCREGTGPIEVLVCALASAVGTLDFLVELTVLASAVGTASGAAAVNNVVACAQNHRTAVQEWGSYSG